jgi:hypothetical protein
MMEKGSWHDHKYVILIRNEQTYEVPQVSVSETNM